MSDIAYRSFAELWPKARTEAENPPRGVGLPWWPRFNEILGGLRPNEITLVCAPTGTGKTTMLANIVAQMILSRVPTFATPVETGPTDFLLQVAASIAGTEFNDGKILNQEKLAYAQEVLLKWTSHTPFNIGTYEDRTDVEDMENQLLYQVQTYGVRVAILDNLNFFLKVTNQNQQVQEMDEAVHRFVMLRKRVPLHILLVVHPKKTDGGRVESEFDIKGSSTAVQECDNVMLFNRPTPQEVERRERHWYDRELVFKKIRKRGYNVNKKLWLTYRGGQYKELVHEPGRSV